jgi:hypothetical protein
MKPEEYSSRYEQVGRWKINIVSYKLGQEYICTVNNVEPGATLSRAQAATREQAEQTAITKAEQMLARTRVNS